MRDRPSSLRQTDPDRYAHLRAEAAAPYRGVRQFFYFSFGASGFVGGLVFLGQVLAGRDLQTALPNLALQSGLVALMVWLFRIEQRAKTKAIATVRQTLQPPKASGSSSSIEAD